MRVAIKPLLVALAASAREISVTSPSDGQCVDLVEDLNVTWTVVENEVSEISFSLVNYRGAYPPIDMPRDFVVTASDLSFSLPGVSHDVAANLSMTNDGMGYQINIVPPNSPPGTAPLAQSGVFMIAENGQC